MTTHTGIRTPAQTARFRDKRDRIIDAATNLINDHGARGMTLAAVANAVGLNTTSVTYYFKRRELLAAACYARAIETIEAIAFMAARQPDPRSRVRSYIHEHFALRARIRMGEDRPFTILSDLRALDGPVRSELAERYRSCLRTVRDFFGQTSTPEAKALNTARTHVLIEVLLWLAGWLSQYDVEDFPRLEARLFDIFDKGLAMPGGLWPTYRMSIDEPVLTSADDSGHSSFLIAATRLINERGYRGASVERITAHLNVTKGSFYHHIDAKDDLVAACFKRSFDIIAQAQHSVVDMATTYWERLASTIATLLDLQFSERAPLLRATALQALPSDVRRTMLQRSDRIARRFAGTIIDGIGEGSIRAVDPLIASQMLMAMLNAAYELQNWAKPMEREVAIRLYASTIAFGLFEAD